MDFSFVYSATFRGSYLAISQWHVRLPFDRQAMDGVRGFFTAKDVEGDNKIKGDKKAEEVSLFNP